MTRRREVTMTPGNTIIISDRPLTIDKGNSKHVKVLGINSRTFTEHDNSMEQIMNIPDGDRKSIIGGIMVKRKKNSTEEHKRHLMSFSASKELVEILKGLMLKNFTDIITELMKSISRIRKE